MLLPKEVLITRQGSNDNVRGVMTVLPNVGHSMRMYLESGRIMTTSPVTKVEDKGSELVVDTKNSRYHLKLAA